VASADSFLLPQLRRRSHRCQARRIAFGNGSQEQMFGAKQQILHRARSDKEAVRQSVGIGIDAP